MSIKDRLEKDVNNKKFIFFLQVHEFESYLFSDIDNLANYFSRIDSKESLERILNEFNNNPELINDTKETVPSKRLEKIYPGFGKTVDELSIIEKIGIPKVRTKCVYFNIFCELTESLKTESKNEIQQDN